MIKENDDFVELLYTKFLADNGHSIRVRAVVAKLFPAWLSCLMYMHVQYPQVFEYQVLASIKQWIIEDAPKAYDGQNENSIGSSLSISSKNHSKVMDNEMLRTYVVSLLAIVLQVDGMVEDVITVGMMIKLMHYLRGRTLDKTNVENKLAMEYRSLINDRARKELRSRARMHLKSSCMKET